MKSWTQKRGTTKVSMKLNKVTRNNKMMSKNMRMKNPQLCHKTQNNFMMKINKISTL